MSMSLHPDELQVTTFETAALSSDPSTGGNSYPDVCTCIGICQPTEDLYCSGGCAPETTFPVDASVAY